MNSLSNATYTFGGFQLDARERILFNGEAAIQLAPKVFDTLLMLVENAGRVLSKERILVHRNSQIGELSLAGMALAHRWRGPRARWEVSVIA